MNTPRLLCFAALFCVQAAGLPPAAYAQTSDYMLGQGLNVGSFNIAGYATIEAQSTKGAPDGLLIDDLSLFIKGSINKAINPFLEAELAEADLWSEGKAPLKRVGGRVDIERLYNDFIVDDHLTFRVGKMLSPVGDWNSIHAGPLVWTTTRPLTTYRNFPEFASGVSVIADGLWNSPLRIEAYWQPAGDIDGPNPANVAYLFHDTFGVHVEWALGLTDKIGLSVQSANVKGTTEKQVLVGLNGRSTFGALEIESELTWTSLRDPLPGRRHKNEYGGYLQGSYEVFENWYVIGRGELFKDRGFDRVSRNFLVGVNYRPRSPIAWKLEYVKQSGQNLGISSGVIASFNILF